MSLELMKSCAKKKNNTKEAAKKVIYYPAEWVMKEDFPSWPFMPSLLSIFFFSQLSSLKHHNPSHFYKR